MAIRPVATAGRVAVLAVGSAVICGCLAVPAFAQTIVSPPTNGQFDYQVGGGYQPAAGVQIVDRDRTEAPAPGVYNICYVNAFQTQTAQNSWWKNRHRSLLLRNSGRFVVDSVWGEIVLDTATPAKRRALARIVGRWTQNCAARGFSAVEFDNLDSYSRSRGLITQADNVAMAQLLVARAHAAGLAAGQKNTSEIGARGREVAKFDFAIAEECERYEECDRYTRVFGSAVIEVEYTDYPRSVFDAACAARGAEISIIRRDRNIVPAGRPGYSYAAC